MTTRTLTLAALITTSVGIAVLAAGCTSASTASAPIEPQTLTLYHVDGGGDLDPAVGWFVDAVSARSDGAITIEVAYDCCGEDVDLEEKLVAAVAGGEADLGWVGTRVLGELGVDSLAALTAPLLIDGYPLQQAVLESSAAQDALAAVSELDVAPLALVPGSIRHPLAAATPVVSLEDWSGLTISAFHSAQNADSLRALGADPVDVPYKERDIGIYDGTIGALENSLLMQDNEREETLPYATVDVGLWPRSSVLIADPDSVAAGGDIAEVLERAAADVVARTGDLGELDAAAMAAACEDGARFALAGADGLAAMRAAVQPEIDSIAENADAAPLLSALLALAEEADSGVPSIPSGCDGEAPSTDDSVAGDDPAVVNGRFQTVVYTEQQLLDAGLPAQEAQNAAGQFTHVFEDGDFELIATQGDETFGCDGTYTVEGDRLVVEYFPGGDCGAGGVFFAATFVVDDQSLTYTTIDAPAATDEFLFGSAPLTRVQ